MTYRDFVEKVADEFHAAVSALYPSESVAYIENARHELARLRSDVISELGHTQSDLFLKASYLAYIDAADSNLQKALL